MRWHPLGAVLAYDAQIAAFSITTVFDSLRAGSESDGSGLGPELGPWPRPVDSARRPDLLRAEHRTTCAANCLRRMSSPTVEAFIARYGVDLISLMDHTPGQRQFRDISKYETYATRGGRSLDDVRKATAWKIEKGRAFNAKTARPSSPWPRTKGIPLASHDDTTLADVDLASGEGGALAEFPTTGGG